MMDSDPETGGGVAAAPGAADTERERAANPVSPKLLESLVCPATGGRLEYSAETEELVSRAGRLAYPIRSGIPIMLIDEARHLPD